jgi:hypothetical protein
MVSPPFNPSLTSHTLLDGVTVTTALLTRERKREKRERERGEDRASFEKRGRVVLDLEIIDY